MQAPRALTSEDANSLSKMLLFPVTASACKIACERRHVPVVPKSATKLMWKRANSAGDPATFGAKRVPLLPPHTSPHRHALSNSHPSQPASQELLRRRRVQVSFPRGCAYWHYPLDLPFTGRPLGQKQATSIASSTALQNRAVSLFPPCGTRKAAALQCQSPVSHSFPSPHAPETRQALLPRSKLLQDHGRQELTLQ